MRASLPQHPVFAPRSFALAAFWIALCASCAAQDVVAVGRVCDSDLECGEGAACVDGRCMPAERDAGPRQDAGALAYCDGSGPPILVSDVGPVVCSGGIAERTFRFALCACEGLVGAAPLRIDSFASAEGPYSAPGGRAGSLGSNARVDLNARLDLTGSLFVAADVSASGAAPITVGTDLHVGGPIGSGASLDVGRHAEVDGTLRASELRVGGTLTLPAGATLDVPAPMVGTEARAPVAVGPPCACADADLVNIVTLVRAHAGASDNALASFDPAGLDGYVGPARIELPCGRLYAPRLQGTGDLTLVVTGRTALFISGDVSFPAAFTVELATADAELDLFIEGGLSADGIVRIGDASRPSRARLYVGGGGTISLSSDGLFAGNLYAPRAELVAAGNVEAFGSVFVRRVSASGFLTLHYDTTVLSAGDACPPRDPPGCASCLDCRNQACVAGACAPCTSDAQCCAPLVCAGGNCQTEPF